MIGISDNLSLAVDSIRAHKLRATLTVLGLIMGVATLITVMTLVQGANTLCRDQDREPGHQRFPDCADALRGDRFYRGPEGAAQPASGARRSAAPLNECEHCQLLGATQNTSVSLRYQEHQLDDATL